MNIFLGHLDVNKMISAFPITYYVLDGDVFSVQNSCLETMKRLCKLVPF